MTTGTVKWFSDARGARRPSSVQARTPAQQIGLKPSRILFAALLAAAPFVAYADGGRNEFHHDADGFKSTRTVAEVRAEARGVVRIGEAGDSFEQWAGPSTRTREDVKRELALKPLPVFPGA